MQSSWLPGFLIQCPFPFRAFAFSRFPVFPSLPCPSTGKVAARARANSPDGRRTLERAGRTQGGMIVAGTSSSAIQEEIGTRSCPGSSGCRALGFRPGWMNAALTRPATGGQRSWRRSRGARSSSCCSRRKPLPPSQRLPEVSLALDGQKPILPLLLEPTTIPPGCAIRWPAFNTSI